MDGWMDVIIELERADNERMRWLLYCPANTLSFYSMFVVQPSRQGITKNQRL